MIRIKSTETHINLKEVTGTHSFELIRDDERIATFELHIERQDNYESLCGWADQYRDSTYWGNDYALLDLVLSAKFEEQSPHSFMLLSNSTILIDIQEFFNGTSITPDVTLKEITNGLLLQLEELRKDANIDLCYFAVPTYGEVTSYWEQALPKWGYESVSKAEACDYYVSKVHPCEDCGEWIPIQDKLCITCDYQVHTYDGVPRTDDALPVSNGSEKEENLHA